DPRCAHYSVKRSSATGRPPTSPGSGTESLMLLRPPGQGQGLAGVTCPRVARRAPTPPDAAPPPDPPRRPAPPPPTPTAPAPARPDPRRPPPAAPAASADQSPPAPPARRSWRPRTAPAGW